MSADPYAGPPLPSDPWSTAGADPWASAAVAAQAAAIAAATAPQMASPWPNVQGPAFQPPPWPAPGFIAQSGPAAATHPSGSDADGWSLDQPAQPTQPTFHGLGGLAAEQSVTGITAEYLLAQTEKICKSGPDKGPLRMGGVKSARILVPNRADENAWAGTARSQEIPCVPGSARS